MIEFPNALHEKLEERKNNNSYRSLSLKGDGVDFYSNDYLGFANSIALKEKAAKILEEYGSLNGSTGSRLISGTHRLHIDTEKLIAQYHYAEEALLYNSGYDANVGLFSSILQKGDVLLFDELIHASVRDGIRLGLAKTYKFKHNSLEELEEKLKRFQTTSKELYVAIETVYSMDGDTAPLKEMVNLCLKYNAKLIVDEAHSTGVFGELGKGLVCELKLEQQIFARVHTFGKAMGVHGAVVLGSKILRDYLINFSRSFIYTTALSIHSVANILASYQELKEKDDAEKLRKLIVCFKEY